MQPANANELPQRITLRLPRGTFVAIDHGLESRPVALCLHGFPDHARSFDTLAPLLQAAGYRCIAPWMRGYAPSTLDGPYDVESLADDAIAIAEALSPTQPVLLIGHDWGAVVAYAAAAKAPQRFHHVVTLAIPHPLAILRNLRANPEQLRLSWYMAFFQLRGVSDLAVRQRGMGLIFRLWRSWSPGYDLPRESKRDLERCLRASLPAPLAYYRALFALTPTSLRQRKALLRQTSRIDVPTLALHGAQDGCMLYALGDGQERWFSQRFERHLMANVGHFLHLEAPDEVAKRIVEFCGRAPNA